MSGRPARHLLGKPGASGGSWGGSVREGLATTGRAGIRGGRARERVEDSMFWSPCAAAGSDPPRGWGGPACQRLSRRPLASPPTCPVAKDRAPRAGRTAIPSRPPVSRLSRPGRVVRQEGGNRPNDHAPPGLPASRQ